MDPVFFRKTFRQIVFMLPDPLDQITGNSNIKRAVTLACQYVDSGLLVHCWNPSLSLCPSTVVGHPRLVKLDFGQKTAGMTTEEIRHVRVLLSDIQIANWIPARKLPE